VTKKLGLLPPEELIYLLQLQEHYIINPKIIFSLFPLGDLWNYQQFPFGLIYLTIKKTKKKKNIKPPLPAIPK